jgi:hypothetical protein
VGSQVWASESGSLLSAWLSDSARAAADSMSNETNDKMSPTRDRADVTATALDQTEASTLPAESDERPAATQDPAASAAAAGSSPAVRPQAAARRARGGPTSGDGEEGCGQPQAQSARSLHQATCPPNPARVLNQGTAGSPSPSVDSGVGFTGSDGCNADDETIVLGILGPESEAVSHASPATDRRMCRAEPEVRGSNIAGSSRRRATKMTAAEKKAYFNSSEGEEKRHQRTLRITRQAEQFMDGRCGATPSCPAQRW